MTEKQYDKYVAGIARNIAEAIDGKKVTMREMVNGVLLAATLVLTDAAKQAEGITGESVMQYMALATANAYNLCINKEKEDNNGSDKN